MKRKKQPAHASLWRTILNFIYFLENLPYGATMLQEKRVARGVLGSGTLIMAFGAAIFTIGWWLHLTWLVEIAFVITLAGWMMLIIGFAFWVVSFIGSRFPSQQGK